MELEHPKILIPHKKFLKPSHKNDVRVVQAKKSVGPLELSTSTRDYKANGKANAPRTRRAECPNTPVRALRANSAALPKSPRIKQHAPQAKLSANPRWERKNHACSRADSKPSHNPRDIITRELLQDLTLDSSSYILPIIPESFELGINPEHCKDVDLEYEQPSRSGLDAIARYLDEGTADRYTLFSIYDDPLDGKPPFRKGVDDINHDPWGLKPVDHSLWRYPYTEK